jgi:peptidyl-Lys metalloendopeptidase
MQQGGIVVCITIVAMMAHGYANGLSVSITPTALSFSSTQKVPVTLTYENNDATTQLIYKWGLPSGELEYPLFTVTLNGENVIYLGRLVKRVKSTVADTIPLPPGKKISVIIDLSAAYDMRNTGEYTIQFEVDANALLYTADSNSATQPADSVLQSEPITLFVKGRANVLSKATVQNEAVKGTIIYGYVGCSQSEQAAIESAIPVASQVAGSCVSYLGALTMGKPRYTTWFGTYSTNNWQILKTHFNNINIVLKYYYMSFDCSCTDPGVFAFVNPSLPYKIHLCDAFWTGPLTGVDSKAGTLIHELSHFTVLAGTKDYAYGHDKCKELAIASPAKAIQNADSHEYFAENTPPLS